MDLNDSSLTVVQMMDRVGEIGAKHGFDVVRLAGGDVFGKLAPNAPVCMVLMPTTVPGSPAVGMPPLAVEVMPIPELGYMALIPFAVLLTEDNLREMFRFLRSIAPAGKLRPGEPDPRD